MKILQRFFVALKFWVTQNIIEITVILLLGYLGIDVMNEFCRKCLLIENIEGAAWGIGFKTLIFLLPYLLLFVLISFLPYFKNNPNNFKYALLNGVISCTIILLIGTLKSKGILLPLLATLISSCIIIFFTKIKAAR